VSGVLQIQGRQQIGRGQVPSMLPMKATLSSISVSRIVLAERPRRRLVASGLPEGARATPGG